MTNPHHTRPNHKIAKKRDLNATTLHNPPLPKGENVKPRERRDGDEKESNEERKEGRREAD